MPVGKRRICAGPLALPSGPSRRWNPQSSMKISVVCLALLIMQTVGRCEDLSLELAINTDEKIAVVGMIHADPPIEVQVEMKHLRKSSVVNFYRVGIGYSRKPSAEELQRLTLSVLPDSNINDPIGYGVVFSERKWKDLDSNPWKVDLKRGLVTLPLKFSPRERLMCRILSGEGYSSMVVKFADDHGNCSVTWEATTGESTIAIIRAVDLREALKKRENPPWKKWKFTPSQSKDPEFIVVGK